MTSQTKVDMVAEARKAYYEGKPIISDQEFNKLYAAYKAEGGPGMVGFESAHNKIEHKVKMLSLDSSKQVNFNYGTCVVTPKMDGLALELVYKRIEQGKSTAGLISASTRGNGLLGEDVTQNAKMIGSLPVMIDLTGSDPDEFVVYGEVILPTRVDETNTRSRAAGIIRRYEVTAELLLLEFYAYGLKDSPKNYYDHTLEYIRSKGIRTVPYNVMFGISINDYSAERLEEICIEMLQTSKINSPIDGAVIRVQSQEAFDIAGYNSDDTAPSGAMAIKFADEEHIATLIDITYDISKSGKYTPVAVFEPIEIDDTIVKRAPLNNETFLNRLFNGEPRVGTKLAITKRNKIMPHIEYLVSEGEGEIIQQLTHCSHCGAELGLSNTGTVENLYCPNSKCKGKYVERLLFFAKALDVKNFTRGLAEDLYSRYDCESFTDIFRIYAYNSVILDNVMDAAVERFKVITYYKDELIYAFGIKGVGSTLSKQPDKLFTNNQRAEIHTCFADLALAGIHPKQRVQGSKFAVITGTFSVGRKELVALLAEVGITVTSSLSSKTDYLLVGDKPGGKLKKAAMLGTVLVRENTISILGIKLPTVGQ